jgi:DNA polymerase-3 subunit beta
MSVAHNLSNPEASRFSIEKNELLTALGHIQSIIDKRNATQILTNFKVEVFHDGNIKFSSTDTQIAAIDLVAGRSTIAGAFTLPAVVYDIVRKLPEGEVAFLHDAANDSQVTMLLGSSTFTFPSLPAEAFPNFEAGELTYEFSLPCEVLSGLLAKTKHSISLDEQRYYLNGIYIHTIEDGSILRFVSTDGHRLAYAQAALETPLVDFPGVILPKKAVNEVCKLLDTHNGVVQIGASKNKMQFKIKDTTLITKLIDAKFADYERAIPKESGGTLEVSNKELARCADLVTSVSAEKIKILRMEVSAEQIVLTASSEINNHATGRQVLDAKYTGKEKVTLAFNSKYLLDVLSSIDGEKAIFSISDSFKAVKVEDVSDANCLYVLMPMQV